MQYLYAFTSNKQKCLGGPQCNDKIRRPEVRKHSVKNAGKFKMAPVNFGHAEEFL